ncbi:MAG: BLUF domain-containing protein [Salinimicrobium sp.]
MEHVICYISTATQNLNSDEVQSLLEEWKQTNLKKELRGILLFSGGHFFQVLEGKKESVLEMFFKIQNDPRHTDIIQVMGKDIQKPSLDHYVVENLYGKHYSKPEVIEGYLESVKGMNPEVQLQIKTILESFIDTRVM